jgi:hypothetical protein
MREPERHMEHQNGKFRKNQKMPYSIYLATKWTGLELEQNDVQTRIVFGIHNFSGDFDIGQLVNEEQLLFLVENGAFARLILLI